jgi:hypothetical protein
MLQYLSNQFNCFASALPHFMIARTFVCLSILQKRAASEAKRGVNVSVLHAHTHRMSQMVKCSCFNCLQSHTVS